MVQAEMTTWASLESGELDSWDFLGNLSPLVVESTEPGEHLDSEEQVQEGGCVEKTLHHMIDWVLGSMI